MTKPLNNQEIIILNYDDNNNEHWKAIEKAFNDNLQVEFKGALALIYQIDYHQTLYNIQITITYRFVT